MSELLPKNAIIYCRVSTMRQTDNKSISLDVQEALCKKFIEKNGLKLKFTCREIGSAYNKLQQLLLDIIQNNSKTTIVVYDVSRFTRNRDKGIELLKLASKNNNQVVFVSDDIIFKGEITKKLNKLIKISQTESENIGRRVKAALKLKKEQGFHIGGVLPYGFSKQATDAGQKLFLNKKEIPIVDFIHYCNTKGINTNKINNFMKTIAPEWNESEPIICYDENDRPINKMKDTLTASEIAGLLNDYNVSYRGKPWTSQHIKSVLNKHTDRALIGLLDNVDLEQSDEELKSVEEGKPPIKNKRNNRTRGRGESNIADNVASDEELKSVDEDTQAMKSKNKRNNWSKFKTTEPKGQKGQKEQKGQKGSNGGMEKSNVADSVDCEEELKSIDEDKTRIKSRSKKSDHVDTYEQKRKSTKRKSTKRKREQNPETREFKRQKH
jgi:DNA invertase Pin-like site-specific DNA recombinase